MPLPTAPPGPRGLTRPAYGSGALADLLPSVLTALGVLDEPDALGLAPVEAVVVLLVDGMGSRLLERSAPDAPFLSSLVARTLTTGFPTTTSASLTSLGTGLPPGVHGLTGYTSLVPEAGGVVSWLRWERDGRDLRDVLVPEQVQPHPTALERAAAAGVAVSVVAPWAFAGSGLTRAALRGGSFVGTLTPGDVVASAAAAARGPGRRLVYAYLPELDLTGHARGVDSDAWRVQLRLVDRIAEELAVRLPDGARLLVTADHGMVDVAEDDKVDADTVPGLLDGVAHLAGEGRARHVHVRPGALEDVRATWTALLGDRAAVLDRSEALELLGGLVPDEVRARVGDLVVVATGPLAVVRSLAEPLPTRLVGQHGALTEDELLVPLLSTG